jgi:ribonuclease HI
MDCAPNVLLAGHSPYDQDPTMSVPAPHFLLFSSARHTRPPHEPAAGQWQFVLEAVDGSSKLEASDAESEISRDRLELWALVRGLEALDQASRVTVVTASRYIHRGLKRGLPAWSENAWQWERFGQLVPVKNADLWRRIHHALQFHQVQCRLMGAPSESSFSVAAAAASPPQAETVPATLPSRNPKARKSLWRRLASAADSVSRGLTDLLPKSHLDMTGC